MNRLSRATLHALPAGIRRPPRGEIGIGIVHFGPGAFHRAHQASYIDALLDHDPRWGIAAVSMRTRATVQALMEQDGLYTITVRDADPETRLIDAHRAFLAPDDAAGTLALLGAPEVQLVTTTVTEKGYCLSSDGTLDLSHRDIVADLDGTGVARSVVGWIVRGLAARHAAGVPPFVVMPCDNVAANGRKLRAALATYARQTDAGLADWIEGELRVPNTMVDSITPASDATFHANVAAALGMQDGAAVQREAFTQWVIEDVGQGGPDLASVGATLTGDVAAWERAKLRILNAAHSTLAYVGLLRGLGTVSDAMRDEWLATFIADMIERDIRPTLPVTVGLDLVDYAGAVLKRFRNPAIAHRLDQIAQDGTQKLPYRLGDTLLANRRMGRLPTHVVAAFGCWLAFVITRSRRGIPIVDVAAETLATAARQSDLRAMAGQLARAGVGLPISVAGDEEALDTIGRAGAAALAGEWAALLPS